MLDDDGLTTAERTELLERAVKQAAVAMFNARQQYEITQAQYRLLKAELDGCNNHSPKPTNG